MHASIRRYIVASGREREATHHAIDNLMPLLEREPGFIAYYFIDSGDGEMIGVSLYDTKAGAQKANTIASTYVAEHLVDFVKRTALVEGEVVAHTARREPEQARRT